MNSYKEVEGCLIEKSLNGEFDVIAHGCNCFYLQKAGIAAQMSKTFNTLDFLLENVALRGSINKLGQIDYEQVLLTSDNNILLEKNYDVPALKINWGFPPLTVVNAYTQYQPGKNLDYEALTLCMRKINHIFKGKHIGLPQIGAGIAGGDWNRIKTIIQQELKDCDVTVVIYNK